MAYKSALDSAKKRFEAQKEWMARIGAKEDITIKNMVIDYFASIRCNFDEKAYNEALSS